MSVAGIWETAETCYSMAYCILPSFLFERPEAIVGRFDEDPRKAVLSFYFAACQRMEHMPCRDAAARLSVRSEVLAEGVRAYVISYPTPPPAGETGSGNGILAPYFSAIVSDENRSMNELYVLGQAPFGGTTLRAVTPTASANLGPGCEPDIDAFIGLLRSRVRAPVC